MQEKIPLKISKVGIILLIFHQRTFQQKLDTDDSKKDK